jgi:hypothetical protein
MLHLSWPDSRLSAAVTCELEEQGVKSFSDSFTVLLEGIEKRRQATVPG